MSACFRIRARFVFSNHSCCLVNAMVVILGLMGTTFHLCFYQNKRVGNTKTVLDQYQTHCDLDICRDGECICSWEQQFTASSQVLPLFQRFYRLQAPRVLACVL